MRDTLKALGKTAIFTVVEIAGVILRLAIGAYLGTAVMAGTFLLEHIISYNVRNGRPLVRLTGLPFAAIALLAVLETATWEAWLQLTGVNGYAAFVVFFAGLILGHAIELNVVRGFDAFTAFGNRLKNSLDITGIESVTGTIWLRLAVGGQGLLAGGVFFAGILVEHLVSARKRII